ncbi:MAG: aspartate kinase [Treponemataceae bacterium]
MIVMKFGGSSVANAQRIKHDASIIKEYKEKKPIVVLSAMGDTTDHLLQAADMAVSGTVDISKIKTLHLETLKELNVESPEVIELLQELNTLLTGISMLKELTKRTRDYLVSFGERLSVRIVCAYLNSVGIESKFYDAWDVGFVSDSNFMNAELLDEVWQTIPEKLGGYKTGQIKEIPIVTGFIAKTKTGYITTLGRGGSDLSATMLGAALGADEVQTWKDVDGIMTADPRIINNARNVPQVTYEEASELAYYGAQVLHPRSMIPCRKTGTPVRVKNSYNINHPGTIIVEKHNIEPESPVRAITVVRGVTMIDIESTRMLGTSGFMAHIFNNFLKWDLSVDVIATSEVCLSLTVKTDKDLSGLAGDIGRVGEVMIKREKAIVTIICDINKSSLILATCFKGLSEKGINAKMISQGALNVNFSMICDESEVDEVVRTIHCAFFE